MMRSLRTRLLVGAAAISIAALGLLGVAIDAAVRHTLLSEFDQILRAKAASLASMVEYHDEKLAFEFNPEQMPEFNAGKDPQYFEIWVDGKVMSISGSLAGPQLPRPAATADTTYSNIILPDGRTGRMVALRASPYLDPDEAGKAEAKAFDQAITLLVARDTQDLSRLNVRLRWTIFTLSAAAIFLSSGALWFIIHRATRPVLHLADQIAARDESDLATSLESGYLPLELVPVVDRLNSLLARLAAAFTRERAFAADVAHELRTPLAGLRATLEVCRSRLRHAVDYEAAMDKSLTLLDQMQTLVENLLMLARHEGGQLTPKPTLIDLTLFLEECWASFAAAAAQRGLTHAWQLPPSLPVATDPNLLRIILTNLFDNAVSYADAGGHITIHSSETNQQIIVEVRNTGSPLNAQELSLVFDRFWRKDPARSQGQRHAGLGLSLCRRLMAVLDGSIAVENAAEIFTARITLNGRHLAELPPPQTRADYAAATP